MFLHVNLCHFSLRVSISMKNAKNAMEQPIHAGTVDTRCSCSFSECLGEGLGVTSTCGMVTVPVLAGSLCAFLALTWTSINIHIEVHPYQKDALPLVVWETTIVLSRDFEETTNAIKMLSHSDWSACVTRTCAFTENHLDFVKFSDPYHTETEVDFW